MQSLRQIVIEPNVLIAYKIFPGEHFVTSEAQLGQSSADWSGLYGQFNLQHAIAYLPNHFDRGHESAMLVSITTRVSMKCLIYDDRRFRETSVSSADKAAALRNSIEELLPTHSSFCNGKPLLQSIGEELNSIVVMYDAEEMECAIPHCMLTDENFVFKTHAIMHRDTVNPWMVKSVRLCAGSILEEAISDDASADTSNVTLTKDERADMKLLARKLENCIDPNRCRWIDQCTEKTSTVAL